MAQAFIPGLTVSRAISLTRLRELPLKGQISVKPGETVNPQQIIARAEVPGDLHILRLAEKMGIATSEVIAGLKIKVGSVIQEGEVVCEHAGLFGWLKTRFASPISGIVEMISAETGHIAVRTESKVIELTAYIAGIVEKIEDNKSVTIRTQGSLVQGIFGVGGERLGSLELLPVLPNHILTEADIPDDCNDLVLVGGTSPSAGVLTLAASRGAVGMVVGSIDDKALSAYVGKDIGIALTGDENVSMSLIITEGFGNLPISDRVINVLSPLNGKFVSLNGATQVRAGAVRPEIIVSENLSNELPGSEKLKGEKDRGLTIGQTIRIIRVPYFGRKGRVTELPHSAEKIPTGAYARVLRVQLEDGEIATVPRANAEIVE